VKLRGPRDDLELMIWMLWVAIFFFGIAACTAATHRW
jgi:hypothetical protein